MDFDFEEEGTPRIPLPDAAYPRDYTSLSDLAGNILAAMARDCYWLPLSTKIDTWVENLRGRVQNFEFYLEEEGETDRVTLHGYQVHSRYIHWKAIHDNV